MFSELILLKMNGCKFIYLLLKNKNYTISTKNVFVLFLSIL